MPTLLQLQSEPWWNDERVTDAMDWLGDELCAIIGVPRDSFGVKGDELHLRGAHRSQQWILKSRFATSRTYTVQSGLPQAFLNFCAGFDFKPKTQAQMNAMSRRMYDAMRAGKLDEVREFYGTFDGRTVVGWDNVNNVNVVANDSHLWHIHATLDRTKVADMATMEKILRTLLGETMTPQDEAKLITDAAMTRSLLHDGKRGGGLPDTAGGGVPIAWVVKQFFDAQNKLDSVLRQVGALTVEMASVRNDLSAIKEQLHNLPDGSGEATLTFDPVTLSGELRFEQPQSPS